MNLDSRSFLQWVEKFPHNWSIIRIKFCLRDGREGSRIGPFGSSLKLSDMVKKGYKVYGQENVISNDFWIGNRFISQDKFDEMKEYAIFPGDILITMMGTVGQCRIVPDAIQRGIIDSHLIRLRTKPDLIFSRYFEWILGGSDVSKRQVELLSQGSIMSGLNSGIIRNIRIPLPPLEIQRLISRFIDKKTAAIDALIAKKKHLIQLLEEKRSALIDRAITKGLNPHVEMKDSGIAWMGVVPKNWKVMRLRYLTAEKVAGPYGSSLTKSMYSSTGYRVYGQQQVISNDFSVGDYYISTEKFQEMRRYEVHPDDVLITVMGTIGRVAVVPREAEPGIINPRLVRYVVRRLYVLPDFFAWVLRSQIGKKQLSEMAQGVTMDGLNLTVLSNTLMPIPPLEEQEHILAYIQKKNEQHDRIRELVDQQIFRLQEYRQSLITSAVTGKINVNEEVIS